MKPAARRLVVFFVLLGLAASLYALYVHYRLLTQPGYSPACDVNETVNCANVYLSSYGTVFDISVALYGVIWFIFVGLLTMALYRAAPQVRESIPGYLFVVSTVGLAVILYLAYAAFFILRSVCLLCITTYVAVIGLFIVTGIATPFAMTTLPRRASRDIRALLTSRLALALSLVFAVATASALAFFPREAPGPEAIAAAAAAEPAATPEQAGGQASDFEKWFVSAPRATVPVSNEGAVVLIVKFTDFFCPSCGQTHFTYKPVIAKYRALVPGAVKLVAKHYPLDTACNPGLVRSLHPLGCAAAVAYEMAKTQKRGDELEDWLYANAQILTLPAIRQAAANIGHVPNWEAGAAAATNIVKADVALGNLLRVSVTPTFFINGVRFDGPVASTALLDQAIALELKKAGKLP